MYLHFIQHIGSRAYHWLARRTTPSLAVGCRLFGSDLYISCVSFAPGPDQWLGQLVWAILPVNIYICTCIYISVLFTCHDYVYHIHRMQCCSLFTASYLLGAGCARKQKTPEERSVSTDWTKYTGECEEKTRETGLTLGNGSKPFWALYSAYWITWSLREYEQWKWEARLYTQPFSDVILHS